MIVKKSGKLLMVMLGVVLFCLSMGQTAFAADVDQSQGVAYSLENANDPLLKNATVVDEQNVSADGKITTTTTYILEDGRKVVDTFTRGDNMRTRSSNGSDTATRTRNIDTSGTVTLTASFSWRTEGYFSYVQCTNAYGSYNLADKVMINKWEIDQTQGETTIGKAFASLNYMLYRSDYPLFQRNGELKITCSDAGTISDNA